MSDTEKDNREHGLLMLALGHAIMQWAFSELQLALLFRALFGGEGATADIFWDRLRNFDAKLQMMNDLATVRLNEANKQDWTLLRAHALSLYSKRNQLAHSTSITTDDGKDALEPFSSVSKPVTIALLKEDVDRYATEFGELSAALLKFTLGLEASQRQQLPEPESDLLGRLRERDGRKREAQRHRALAWRQYLDRNPDLKIE